MCWGWGWGWDWGAGRCELLLGWCLPPLGLYCLYSEAGGRCEGCELLDLYSEADCSDDPGRQELLLLLLLLLALYRRSDC